MPADHHPSLSLEVPQAEKSICPPGTHAWSLPANISSGQRVGPPTTLAPGLIQSVEGRHLMRLLYPKTHRPALKSQARPHPKPQANTRPWKALARRKPITPGPGCPSGTLPRWSSDTPSTSGHATAACPGSASSVSSLEQGPENRT